MSGEAQQLAEARERSAALGNGRWQLSRDGAGRFLEVKTERGFLLEVLRFDPAATEAEIEFYAHAAETVRLLLRLVDRCADRVRALVARVGDLEARVRDLEAALARLSSPSMGEVDGRSPDGGGETGGSLAHPAPGLRPDPPHRGEGGGAKDFAAEAAMRCGDAAFRRWLVACHGLESPATDEGTAQRLRELLGVASRRELNTDAEAAERWRRLRGEFEAWLRAGRDAA